MTLPTSGPLATTDIQTEFGGTNPIGLNEYYAGGGLVPAGTSGTYGAVPSSGALSIQNFYGTSNFIPVYIEELFSTFLYNGNGSTQTITNGIDLAGEGGLVWIKNRATTSGFTFNHFLFDTSRGPLNRLITNNTDSSQGTTGTLTSFNANGFSLGSDSGGNVNYGPGTNTYASWTFRKQPKFFDIVTYTGNGANGRTVAHNLGSVPGCMMVKRTDSDGDWMVYHRSIGNTKILRLQTTGAELTGVYWNNTTPTEAVFTVNDMGLTTANPNASGGTYVAYLFAHDAGGFGESGTDNVISCGSYTVSGNEATVTLGYEPQWTLTKRTDSTDEWRLIDVMRGSATEGGQNRQLYANLSDAEGGGTAGPHPTATGFTVQGVADGTYIYIAIRRGPMKVPTTGTSVFAPQINTGDGTAKTQTVGFPPDLSIAQARGGDGPWWMDRLRAFSNTQGVALQSNSTAAEFSFTTANSGVMLDGTTTGQVQYTSGNGNLNSSTQSYANWFFRRAPGFFDEVCYTGDNTYANSQRVHNLGVPPELTIIKNRTNAESWQVLWSQQRANLNRSDSFSSSPYTANTSTLFSTSQYANGASSENYAAYLFATCAGVSKVGSYTGTGTTQTINCGFTGGARFVLIKRTDSTGDWYVWDSARGIVAGNDPYLLLNSTAAEVTSTDYVDTAATGFEISSTAPAAINASGGTFIFLAIA